MTKSISTNEYIRELHPSDIIEYEKMDTALTDDYLKNAFVPLTKTPSNQLFGLWSDERLEAIAGYTQFADFAMIGRLRTAVSARGKGYGKQILAHALSAALSVPEIRLVGSYTAKDNEPAKAVLRSLGLSIRETVYTCKIKQMLVNENATDSWTRVKSPSNYEAWIASSQNPPSTVTIEAYFPFPGENSQAFQVFSQQSVCYMHQQTGAQALFTFDEKDNDFLLLNVSDEGLVQDQQLWRLGLSLAKKHNRILRFDATDSTVHKIPSYVLDYTVAEPWLLFETRLG
ncbi:GNAT family N-acetyltransferase [Bacillaceae bacterium SIJ1]|uniref:GNAT family N-acetyltransferase n=1 Tax=Litoribacterium kuwaitense TaxID=1398745 RepID=UPI0013EC2FCB|nr:GNAT family N-acetyltransferase [Litoribacterium kuwaitense]NGP46622.1 GNAT family N-acetyltransferase [Litoribacterium kuwaitense]